MCKAVLGVGAAGACIVVVVVAFMSVSKEEKGDAASSFHWRERQVGANRVWRMERQGGRRSMPPKRAFVFRLPAVLFQFFCFCVCFLSLLSFDGYLYFGLALFVPCINVSAAAAASLPHYFSSLPFTHYSHSLAPSPPSTYSATGSSAPDCSSA